MSAARERWRTHQEQAHARELEVNDLRHRRDTLVDRLREDYQVELAELYQVQRGEGVATSLFGTYVQGGELLVYPFYEYSANHDQEYKPAELGFGLEQSPKSLAKEGTVRGDQDPRSFNHKRFVRCCDSVRASGSGERRASRGRQRRQHQNDEPLGDRGRQVRS